MLDLEIAEVHEKASSDKEKFFEEISEFYKNKIDYVEKDYEMACNQIEELQKEIEKIEVISKIHKERDENFAKINSVALNKVKGLEVRFRQDKLMRRESELSNLMEELEILSKLQAERNEGQEELQRKYENALQVIEEKEKKNQEYNAVLIRLQDFEVKNI